MGPCLLGVQLQCTPNVHFRALRCMGRCVGGDLCACLACSHSVQLSKQPCGNVCMPVWVPWSPPMHPSSLISKSCGIECFSHHSQSHG